MIQPDALLYPTPQGLYCPVGDFHIDPVRAVPRAVITHGHADHARAGHGSVLATPETLDIMAVRYGETFTSTRQALRPGDTVSMSGVDVRFAPAGHVFGSAQAVISHRGLKMVVTGDFKRRRDPTCARFEVERANVLITEATFGLPVFRHPDDRLEIDKLLRSVRSAPDRAFLVGAYSLGKAQRLIALIREAGWHAPIYLHGSMTALCALYQARGVELGSLLPATLEPGERGERDRFAGQIVLAPPSSFSTAWARRFPDPVACFASGWMRVRQRSRQRGVELPLVISDHADWDELTQTVRDVDPEEVWVTHGAEDALVRWAGLEGRKARPLRLIGNDDGGDAD
jgi:putative mRNA 3-end processing factor